jgi:hypothetical protein
MVALAAVTNEPPIPQVWLTRGLFLTPIWARFGFFAGIWLSSTWGHDTGIHASAVCVCVSAISSCGLGVLLSGQQVRKEERSSSHVQERLGMDWAGW